MHKVCCSVLDTLAQRLVLPCLNGFGGARHHIVGSPVERPMCVVLEGDLLRMLSLLQMRLRLCLAAGLTSRSDRQLVIHPSRFEIPTTQKLCEVISIFYFQPPSFELICYSVMNKYYNIIFTSFLSVLNLGLVLFWGLELGLLIVLDLIS